MWNCCCVCYKLVDCVTLDVIYTKTDLSAYVGHTISLVGHTGHTFGVYKTSQSECAGQTFVAVTVDSDVSASLCLCYKLVNCADGTDIKYTRDDLSSFVGLAISDTSIPPKSYDVTVATSCPSPAPFARSPINYPGCTVQCCGLAVDLATTMELDLGVGGWTARTVDDAGDNSCAACPDVEGKLEMVNQGGCNWLHCSTLACPWDCDSFGVPRTVDPFLLASVSVRCPTPETIQFEATVVAIAEWQSNPWIGSDDCFSNACFIENEGGGGQFFAQFYQSWAHYLSAELDATALAAGPPWSLTKDDESSGDVFGGDGVSCITRNFISLCGGALPDTINLTTGTPDIPNSSCLQVGVGPDRIICGWNLTFRPCGIDPTDSSHDFTQCSAAYYGPGVYEINGGCYYVVGISPITAHPGHCPPCSPVVITRANKPCPTPVASCCIVCPPSLTGQAPTVAFTLSTIANNIGAPGGCSICARINSAYSIPPLFCDGSSISKPCFGWKAFAWGLTDASCFPYDDGSGHAIPWFIVAWEMYDGTPAVMNVIAGWFLRTNKADGSRFRSVSDIEGVASTAGYTLWSTTFTSGTCTSVTSLPRVLTGACTGWPDPLPVSVAMASAINLCGEIA